MKHKWGVSLSEYPFDYYPNYIFGGCVIVSMQTVKEFTIAAAYTKIFKFEDVYLGILASKLGINATANKNVSQKKVSSLTPAFQKMIASHLYGDYKEMRKAWKCHLVNLDHEEDNIGFCEYLRKRFQEIQDDLKAINTWIKL